MMSWKQCNPSKWTTDQQWLWKLPHVAAQSGDKLWFSHFMFPDCSFTLGLHQSCFSKCDSHFTKDKIHHVSPLNPPELNIKWLLVSINQHVKTPTSKTSKQILCTLNFWHLRVWRKSNKVSHNKKKLFDANTPSYNVTHKAESDLCYNCPALLWQGHLRSLSLASAPAKLALITAVNGSD